MIADKKNSKRLILLHGTLHNPKHTFFGLNNNLSLPTWLQLKPSSRVVSFNNILILFSVKHKNSKRSEEEKYKILHTSRYCTSIAFFIIIIIKILFSLFFILFYYKYDFNPIRKYLINSSVCTVLITFIDQYTYCILKKNWRHFLH